MKGPEELDFSCEQIRTHLALVKANSGSPHLGQGNLKWRRAEVGKKAINSFLLSREGLELRLWLRNREERHWEDEPTQ